MIVSHKLNKFTGVDILLPKLPGCASRNSVRHVLILRHVVIYSSDSLSWHRSPGYFQQSKVMLVSLKNTCIYPLAFNICTLYGHVMFMITIRVLPNS